MEIILFSDQKIRIVAKPTSITTRPRLRFNLNKYRLPINMSTQASQEFTPIRILGNIAIEDADNPGTYPKNLGQEVTLRINYLPYDLEKVGNYPLSLGYWDGIKWIRFATPELVNALEPDQGGYAFIILNQTPWNGDPPVAWGK